MSLKDLKLAVENYGFTVVEETTKHFGVENVSINIVKAFLTKRPEVNVCASVTSNQYGNDWIILLQNNKDTLNKSFIIYEGRNDNFAFETLKSITK